MEGKRDLVFCSVRVVEDFQLVFPEKVRRKLKRGLELEVGKV